MTRNETGILATGLADLRERQAVTETKMDAMADAVKAMTVKIDAMSEAVERTERAVTGVQSTVEGMKPDVQTIADIKRAGKFGAWMIGGIIAVGSAVGAAKGWIVLNFNWLFSR